MTQTYYAYIDKGFFIVELRSDDRQVVRLDTHDKDFESKLEEALFKNQIIWMMCSSSIDFPEDDDAPAETVARFERASEKAAKRLQHKKEE